MLKKPLSGIINTYDLEVKHDLITIRIEVKFEDLCILKSPGLNDVVGKHIPTLDMVYNNVNEFLTIFRVRHLTKIYNNKMNWMISNAILL